MSDIEPETLVRLPLAADMPARGATLVMKAGED
jgi:hypothetical protein